MFDFVSGGNATNQSIEMTSPVFLTGEQTRAMSFIMPQEVVEKGVPAPRDSRVQLEEMEAARWVALRFSGEQSPEVFGVALGKLRAYLSEKASPSKASRPSPFTIRREHPSPSAATKFWFASVSRRKPGASRLFRCSAPFYSC